MPPVVLLLLVVLCFGLAGCGTSDDGYQFADESLIEVPDVQGGDGAKAVSAVEAEGLEATLADAGDDFDFDSLRDPTGCEVTHQRPAAGRTLSKGEEVTITVDCRQADWEKREGADWEAFDGAYDSAFDDGCDALFESSSTASLTEGGQEYTATDCQVLNPGDAAKASGVPSDVPDEPEAAGAEAGELDGCRALFEDGRVFALGSGADSITVDDCPLSD